MGDRTSVTLSIPTVLIETALPFLDNYQDESNSETLSYFTYYEVNYGELDFLCHLIAAGIPFDSEWCAGSEYGAGCKSCRFTPEGEEIINEIYDDGRNPCHTSLMALIDNPSALRAYILAHDERIKVLPWDNQVEYGKLYRTKQLINPQ